MRLILDEHGQIATSSMNSLCLRGEESVALRSGVQNQNSCFHYLKIMRCYENYHFYLSIVICKTEKKCHFSHRLILGSKNIDLVIMGQGQDSSGKLPCVKAIRVICKEF